MKLLAENQLVGTSPGFAVFRNLFERPDGRLTEYPPEAQIFARHRL